MPSPNATNSKGKVPAKAKSRDTHLESTDHDYDPNYRTNVSVDLPAADDRNYGEDGDGYGYDMRAQRLRFPLRQTWKSYILTGLLAILTILLGLGLLVLVIADSYAAPAISRLQLLLEAPESVKIEFLNNALVLGGPESVRLDSVERRVSEGGHGGLEVNATVAVRIGVDTDYIMGFQNMGNGLSWLDKAWMRTVRWAVVQLGDVTVHIDQLELSQTNYGDHRTSNPLIIVHPTSLIPVSLCPYLRTLDIAHSPATRRCHTPLLHLAVSVYPADNATDILAFLENSWKDGWLKVDGSVSRVTVIGGAPLEPDVVGGLIRPDPGWDARPKWWQFSQWRRWIRVYRPSVETKVALKVPPLKFPDMPPLEPGSDLPEIADLVVLESFSASTSTSPQPTSFDAQDPDFHPFQHILTTHNDKDEDWEFIEYSELLQDPESVTLNGPNIVLMAQASLIHPFGDFVKLLNFGLRVPPIPFIISLPVPPAEDKDDPGNLSLTDEQPSSAPIPVVKVFSTPSFNQTHIRLPIWGYVLPLPPSLPDSFFPRASPTTNYNLTADSISSPSSPNTVKDFTRAVSAFIRSYLSYEPAPIFLTTPFYPSLTVTAAFPPPQHKLQIIRDVKLQNMWIKPGGIFGAVANPRQGNMMANIMNGVMEIGRDNGRKMLCAWTCAPAGREDAEKPEGTDVWSSFVSSFALEVLASATVHARVVLPRGFNIDLEVTRIWVDALIFDGDVPAEDEDEDGDEVEDGDGPGDGGDNAFKMMSNADEEGPTTGDPTLPTPFPLPTPLPPRAFARITPKTWLNATSSFTKPGEEIEVEAEDPEDEDSSGKEDDDNEDDGKSVYVTAEAVDVPLQVLPGRQADLRRFVTKVLFSSDPVIAGVRGVVAVAVKIPGLTVQTESETMSTVLAADSHHTSHHKRDIATLISSTSHRSAEFSGKPEADPRIEGSEVILTDLPFEGKVPIGGSRAWISG